MKMKSLTQLKKELFKDPEFRKAYDALGPEFELVSHKIEAKIKKNEAKKSKGAREKEITAKDK